MYSFTWQWIFGSVVPNQSAHWNYLEDSKYSDGCFPPPKIMIYLIWARSWTSEFFKQFPDDSNMKTNLGTDELSYLQFFHYLTPLYAITILCIVSLCPWRSFLGSTLRREVAHLKGMSIFNFPRSFQIGFQNISTKKTMSYSFLDP